MEIIRKDVTLYFTEKEWSKIEAFLSESKLSGADDEIALRALLKMALEEFFYQRERRETE